MLLPPRRIVVIILHSIAHESGLPTPLLQIDLNFANVGYMTLTLLLVYAKVGENVGR
jgi:hypothetical protein